MRQLCFLEIFCLAIAWMSLTLGINPAFGLKGEILKQEHSLDSNQASDKKGSRVITLTLNQALELALSKSPELAAARFEIFALEGGAIQAGLFPNPELGLELEHFGGSGDFEGVNAAERTGRVSQLIELAGKRSKRKHVASLEATLARLDYETKRLDVVARVHKNFIEALSAQKRMGLVKELTRLAQQVLTTASERVKAGKASPLEETKAKVALSKTLIDLRRAQRELTTMRKRLASNWGAVSPDFKRVEGDLESIERLPAHKKLRHLVLRNPDLTRSGIEVERRHALLNSETSKRWPDLTLGGGVRYYDQTDDHAFLAGLSIPLPFFSRNQGAILEAQQRISKAKEERRITYLSILTSLAQAYQELSTASAEVTILKKDVLPGAHQAFEAAREGYKQGKLNYLDVLDAQRTLFEARTQYFDVLANYHKTMAEVERLTGASHSDIKDLEKKELEDES